MISKQRLVYIPLVGTILLCLIIMLFSTKRKRSSKSTSSKKVTKHKVVTSPDEVLKYWTADKMRDAQATPLPESNNLDRGKQNPRPSPTKDT